MKKIKIMAAIAALLTCISVFLYLNSLKGSTSKENKIEVVVAAKDIPSQTAITPEMVEKKFMPASAVLPGTAKNPDEIVGKIIKSDILQGEMILNAKFYTKNDSSAGLACSLPKGTRAVTMMVDLKSGLNGLIRPGNFVDILAIICSEDNNNAASQKAKLILEKIKVVAVGELTNGSPNEKTPMYQTVTLAVKPEDAIKLALCDYSETKPKITCQLLLRPQDDDKPSNAKTITVNDIIQ